MRRAFDRGDAVMFARKLPINVHADHIGECAGQRWIDTRAASRDQQHATIASQRRQLLELATSGEVGGAQAQVHDVHTIINAPADRFDQAFRRTSKRAAEQLDGEILSLRRLLLDRGRHGSAVARVVIDGTLGLRRIQENGLDMRSDVRMIHVHTAVDHYDSYAAARRARKRQLRFEERGHSRARPTRCITSQYPSGPGTHALTAGRS